MSADGALNRLVIDGVVVTEPETRYSPAGIPITRFTLEHRSRQLEADMPREAYCRIGIVAAGEAQRGQLQAMKSGDRIRVEGFVSRIDYRSAESRLALHAKRIERLD